MSSEDRNRPRAAEPERAPDDDEIAAAAIYLAMTGARDPLPDEVRRRVERQALDIVGPNPK